VAVDGERKTVTALFADIKGSTELMRDLDPEEARAIVDPALKLMIDAVHATAAISCNPPAMASSRCLGRRSPMKTIRNAHFTRRCACRTKSGATPTASVRKGARRFRFGSVVVDGESRRRRPPLSTIAFSAGLLDSTGTGHPPAGTGLTVLCAPNNPRRQEGSRPWELTRFFLCQRDSDRSWDQSAAHTLMDVLDGLRR
jgi:hypothetical protein